MTDKKKPPESSDGKSPRKISFNDICFKGICGKVNILSDSGDNYIAKSDLIVTRSKLPEPTEPPPPIVAKPKK